MPTNETEYHPYIAVGETIRASRMIIGTFPIYSLTIPETQHKNQLQQRGDISFFYGSKKNKFWRWYKEYIDQDVQIENPQLILKSLQNNCIAISDVIKECSRIDESFEDSKLRNIKWNLNLASVIEERIDKIICTSKSASGAMGWLRDKVLIPAGFTINYENSNKLHQKIISKLPQNNLQIRPIAQVLSNGSKKISIVALPSPGSPQRRLIDFGHVKEGSSTSSIYLQAYLSQTFNWFMQ